MGLKLTDISHTYAPTTPFAVEALANIDLNIEVGRTLVILGPTGSGKSTLLGIACGLVRPTLGSLALDGVNDAGVLVGREAGVGLVFQAPENQLFAEFVLDDVAFGPLNLGLGREAALERARDSLPAVGMDPAVFGDRSPFALSGGEARRVALAGVLAMKPAYLLLDEPTAGLDARGRDGVLAVLDELAPTTGIVIVTHDAEEFLGRADDVLVLAQGRSEYWGPVEGLLANPAPLLAAGLVLPDVVRVLHDARDVGVPIELFTADPVRAARILAAGLAKVRS
ncbi:MAG: ATP-binding cassette domain-containing protein [Coriobacteriia bacterium]|nr:ATP-binding cassette domain-containing protein [Coriobacteriia bacterium]